MNKEEIIEQIKNQQLNDDQIQELLSVLNGELSERHLMNKASDLASDFFSKISSALTPNKYLLLYRFSTLLTICCLIYFLAIRDTENSQQVWTIVGAFIGFIFGQKSTFLRF